MLNSGEKIALCATKKNNILTLVLYEKKILNETKNHNPPPPLQVKWLVPKWHSKENTTKSYKNFVLQKLSLKDGGKHIYIYIIHSTCNIVTIRFKGREGGLKHPYKISWPTKFVNNVCVTQKRPPAVNLHITDIHIHIRCTN
jgi:hypothetical protein